MHALVTGVAGFIGSQLAHGLLDRGDEVIGLDCLTSYYDISQKRFGLKTLQARDGFRFVELDLRSAPLEETVDGCDTVYHQAAQPGVRSSWQAFPAYVDHNVLATQRLLEAVRSCGIRRLVYASSSSIYGNAAAYPTPEHATPQPHSPYGVTKLAGEHLVRLYGLNWGVPTVSLRYFTVYGPGQRPDMAIYRLIEGALFGKRFPMYGDGAAIRDFTFVRDVVQANLLAGDSDIPAGSVFNIAGGGSISLKELIETIGELSGRAVPIAAFADRPGDVLRTGGDTTAARLAMGWRPQTSMRDGLAAQIDWHRSRMG